MAIEIQAADLFLVDIVVHTASSIDAQQAIGLIKALGKRGEITGKDTYHIHVSQCRSLVFVVGTDILAVISDYWLFQRRWLAIWNDQGW